ncbi:MAG: HAD hydrolase-like protein [Bacteroidota bacterium]
MKTLLIFDIDGTLLHSNKIDSQCFATTYEQLYGKPFPSIDWRNYPHVSDTTIFGAVIQEHFGREPEQEEVRIFQDAFVSMIEERRREKPGDFMEVPSARSTFERLLADDRYVLGIATGGWERPARVKLAHINLPTDALIMSFADGKLTREHIIQDVLDEVARRSIPIRRTVYIGDAPWDVRTTRNMSMPLVGIRRRGDMQHLHELGASHVLQDYSDFDAFIQATEQAQVPI